MSRKKDKDLKNTSHHNPQFNKKQGFFDTAASLATAGLLKLSKAFSVSKPKPEPKKILTEFDHARIAKAKIKRERKAARREAEARGCVFDYHCSTESWIDYQKNKAIYP